MTRLADYAETLYDVLPQDTYEAIRQAMSVVWPGISLGTVSNTVHWVRTHPDEAGYNISYVKRGAPGWTETGRLFAICKDDPSFQLNDEHREHFDNGILMTVLTTKTFFANQVEMLVAGQAHEARRVAREALEDLQEEFSTFSRRMRRVQRIIERKRNGTDDR